MNKKIIVHFLALVGLLIFLYSCSKNDDVVPSTTTGTSPQFTGIWLNSENSSKYGSSTYTLKITDSTNSDFILFAYLYGYHTKVKATTLGNNISIPSQIIEGNSVSGSCSLINSARMSLTYYINTGLSKDTINCVLTK